MSEPPANPNAGGASPAGKRAWLGKLSTYLASFAGGAAVNDLSGTLGYHGLAGAIALLGVVTAATWIRGLDPRARLPRRAPWLFLAPAACAAATAAFSSGAAASILTAAAAILTVGAVLVAKELQSAARLLTGAALIVGGAAVIAGATASIADGNTTVGAAIISVGVSFLAAGGAYIGGRDKLAGAALIAAGAAVTATGATIVTTGTAITALGNTAVGLAIIFYLGVGLITDGPMLITRDSAHSPAGATWLTREEVEKTSFGELLRRGRVTFKPASSIASAIAIAALAGGTSKVARGVTPAGAAHIAERDTLVWLAFVAYLAAQGALVAVAGDPRAIARRARRAIDWATKAPSGTEESNAQASAAPDS